jgi:hypothetical protein
MREELEKALCADFPEMFVQKEERTSSIMYGLEVGDGWEPIIRKLCTVLDQRGFIYLKEKDKFPKQQVLKRIAHNICRKVEKLLGMKCYTLYRMNYPTYEKFKGYGVEFRQIKEKFGTLRVYYDIVAKFEPADAARFDDSAVAKERERYDGFVYGAVSYAELESETICEHDGSPANLRTDGWWRTLCDSCEEKRKTKI